MKRDLIEVLREAILFERRGKEFYSQVARQTPSPAAREVFSLMAGEEERHIQALVKLGQGLEGEGGFPEREGEPAKLDSLLTEQLRREIQAASYEAAAIYAAMGLEEKAIAFYSQQAQESEGEVKELFQWLADWERGHLELLMALDEDLRRQAWADSHFWPF